MWFSDLWLISFEHVFEHIFGRLYVPTVAAGTGTTALGAVLREVASLRIVSTLNPTAKLLWV
jgi:hypothetical protein